MSEQEKINRLRFILEIAVESTPCPLYAEGVEIAAELATRIADHLAIVKELERQLREARSAEQYWRLQYVLSDSSLPAEFSPELEAAARIEAFAAEKERRINELETCLAQTRSRP